MKKVIPIMFLKKKSIIFLLKELIKIVFKFNMVIISMLLYYKN